MSKSQTPSDPVRSAIGKALGRIPSGLFILTAQGAARPMAMLVSWAQQAGFDPPAVCVALAKDRPIRAAVESSGRFALSVLSHSDSALLKRYARGVPEGTEPFEGVAVTRTPGGQIALVDSLAWLDCRLLRVCDFGGDHDLLVAEVTAGEVQKEGASFTHLRGSGLHY